MKEKDLDKLIDRILKEERLDMIPFSIKSHSAEAKSLLISMHKKAANFQHHKIKGGGCREKDPMKQKECQKYHEKVEVLWDYILKCIDKALRRYM